MLDIRLRDFGRRRVDSLSFACVARWCMGKERHRRMLAFRRFQSGEVRASPFLYLGGVLREHFRSDALL